MELNSINVIQAKIEDCLLTGWIYIGWHESIFNKLHTTHFSCVEQVHDRQEEYLSSCLLVRTVVRKMDKVIQ